MNRVSIQFCFASLVLLLSACNPLAGIQGSNSIFNPGVNAPTVNPSVVVADQTDDATNIFSGGTSTGTFWDSTHHYLRLDQTGLANDLELNSSWTPAWSNLVGYWKLNEAASSTNVIDSSGNGNDGTTQGTVTFGGAGKLGTSLEINSAGHVALPSVFPAGAYTISGWVYRRASTGGAYNLFSSEVGSGHALYLSDLKLVGYHDVNNYTEDPESFPIETWTHVALTFDPNVNSGKMMLYRNGTLVSSATSVPNHTDTTAGIGAFNGSSIVDGKLDDFALWNKALSPSSISMIYQHQSAKYAGTFTSRVMNGLSAPSTWENFSWTSTLPFFKEIPDEGVSESPAHYSSQTVNLSTDLMALWHLNEIAGTTGNNVVIDRSGNGNHGSRNGAVVFGNQGKFGGSAYFDGLSDPNISIQTQAVTNAAYLGTHFTMAAWFKASINSDTKTILRSTYGAAGDVGMMANWPSGDPTALNKIGCRMPGSGGVISLADVNDGQWHHVVCSMDGTLDTIYIDGVFDNSNNTSSNSPTVDAQWVIGNYPGGGVEQFQGNIDEVAIWGRAITSAEVNELYRRGANRIQYQMRSCPDATCNTNPVWIGPEGDDQTYFSELHNTLANAISAQVQTNSPLMIFSHFLNFIISPQQYFQYRAILESDDTSTSCLYGTTGSWCSPELNSVTVGPIHSH